jgi:hypothetical protein
MNKLIAVLAGLLIVTGCGGAADPTQEEGITWRTIVELRADGSSEVTTTQVTRAQQRADVDARERSLQHREADSSLGTLAQGISADPTCNGADLWLFDDYNQTGSNELCFFGSGGVWLRDYFTYYCSTAGCFVSTWEHAVRSYWAGISPGNFTHFIQGPPYHLSEGFDAWQRVDQAGLFARQSETVALLR